MKIIQPAFLLNGCRGAHGSAKASCRSVAAQGSCATVLTVAGHGSAERKTGLAACVSRCMYRGVRGVADAPAGVRGQSPCGTTPALALLFVVALAFTTRAAERPVYPCHLLPSAPTIDGKLDDDAWKSVPEATGFFIYAGNGKYAVEKQTAFKVGWMQDSIFLALRAEETAPDKLVSTAKDGCDLWTEDSIEFFLFPTGAPKYMQFIVNSKGGRWNGVGLNEKPMDMLAWEAKATVGPDAWCMELRLPFSVLGGTPKDGVSWPMNVARNILTGPSSERLTCWPPLSKGFHELENFGTVVFKGAAGGDVAQEERETNRAYAARMVDRTRQFQAAAADYAEVIAEGLKRPDMQKEAGELKAVWDVIATFAAQPAPDYRELAKAFRTFGTIKERSSDFKARVLMELLLAD
ncbi:MAG: hypothetical protein A3K19_17000 [Lentisphaerae bacterium RIFOXYB12_FULL_65_16]|nr:MAG: hypothetical protein A3K18_17960 [Lentisphaerae bacterium RIFOXYA12_64_32]OGV88945.1 MAG: hypothetical protein A3K19_17000 [Lentisphaerae bacterium RIFOXYB12_FULL_65_16]